MSHRLLEVDAARVPRWVAGFGERHGDVVVTREPASDGDGDGDAVRLVASDGAVAVLEPCLASSLPGDADPVEAVAAAAGRHRHAALLLVRRGGWVVGLSDGPDLVQHKGGTKYAQSRTAAGGWSQQRFARRRAGQAAGLVGAAAEGAHAVWSGAGGSGAGGSGAGGSGAAARARPEVLVVGGDRALLEEVLADPRLARVAALPRSPVLDVRDPRLDVLREAVRRSRAVRIRLDEPD